MVGSSLYPLFCCSTYKALVVQELPVINEKVYEKPVKDILADLTKSAYVTVSDSGDKQTFNEMLSKFAHINTSYK